jgi:hypothetical protein
MKQFKENYQPIEIELTNKDEESFIIKSKFLTSTENRAIEEILKDESKTWTDRCLDVMVIWFGNTKEFYEQFSMNLLSDIALYMKDIQTKKK